jgi:hypothetical protein
VANLILTGEGWQSRVRSRLGVDAAYLPDAEIEMPEIISIAEANIIEQVADYASLTGTDLIYLEAATVCECAVLLCAEMPTRLPQREQGPHFSQEVVVDWQKMKAELEDKRDRYLARLSTMTVPTVPHFQVHNHRW